MKEEKGRNVAFGIFFYDEINLQREDSNDKNEKSMNSFARTTLLETSVYLIKTQILIQEDSGEKVQGSPNRPLYTQ